MIHRIAFTICFTEIISFSPKNKFVAQYQPVLLGNCLELCEKNGRRMDDQIQLGGQQDSDRRYPWLGTTSQKYFGAAQKKEGRLTPTQICGPVYQLTNEINRIFYL